MAETLKIQTKYTVHTVEHGRAGVEANARLLGLDTRPALVLKNRVRISQ